MPTIYCSLCQEQLPDTGVPITRHRFDHMREMFDDYVKNRTLQNWKFWIVSFNLKLFSPTYWFYSVATWHVNQPSVSGYPFCPLHLHQQFSISVLACPCSAYFACRSLLTHLIQFISSLEVSSVYELFSE